MARFNLDDYETVEERHARALQEHPDLRCVIVNHTTPEDRAVSTWVVEARVYKDAGDQAADIPKATEWASRSMALVWQTKRPRWRMLARLR